MRAGARCQGARVETSKFRASPGQVGVPDVERGGDRLAGTACALGPPFGTATSTGTVGCLRTRGRSRPRTEAYLGAIRRAGHRGTHAGSPEVRLTRRGLGARTSTVRSSRAHRAAWRCGVVDGPRWRVTRSARFNKRVFALWNTAVPMIAWAASLLRIRWAAWPTGGCPGSPP